MPPSIATPKILREPGFLFWAPLGSEDPEHTAAGSVFTDEWPIAWVPLGATEEGSELSTEQSIEAIKVAELFEPVAYDVVEMMSKIGFALADYTLTNIKRAMNGGALTLVSGIAGPTAVHKLTPPEPADITRCMIGWESLDRTMRLIAPQCLNGAAMTTSFKRSPDKALIPFELNFERPLDRTSFDLYGTSARLGA